MDNPIFFFRSLTLFITTILLEIVSGIKKVFIPSGIKKILKKLYKTKYGNLLYKDSYPNLYQSCLYSL